MKKVIIVSTEETPKGPVYLLSLSCKHIKRITPLDDPRDYAKPLDVRWLCQPCHADWHRLYG